MKGHSTLGITFVVILIKYLPLADAFQCFECENCQTIGGNARDYITECNLPDTSFSTQKPELKTTAGVENSTATQGLMISSTENHQNSTISSSSAATSTNSTQVSSSTLSTPTTANRTETTTMISTSTSSTTQKQETTFSWSIFPKSIEENQLGSNGKPNVFKARQANAVCYVLKFKNEGRKIIRRGCGAKTCQSVSQDQPDAECSICEGNLCNGASKLGSKLVGIFLIFVAFICFNY